MLLPKSNRGLSALYRTQALCRDHDLSTSSDVHAVQALIKNAFVALVSSHNDAESLVEHTKVCKRSSTNLEASF